MMDSMEISLELSETVSLTWQKTDRTWFHTSRPAEDLCERGFITMYALRETRKNALLKTLFAMKLLCY